MAQGRSPGFVARLQFDAELELIVVSLSNSYAVPSDWVRALADLALRREMRDPWPMLEPVLAPVPADDPRRGRYRTSRGQEIEIERSDRGALFVDFGPLESIVGLVPLADGSFLLPLYFQRCARRPEAGQFPCRMLSGESRYTSTDTRLP